MSDEAMTTLELLLKWEQLLYPVLAVIVGGLVWLVRLEAKANSVHRDIIRLEETMDQKVQLIERLIRALSRDVNQLIGSINKSGRDSLGRSRTLEDELDHH